MKAEGRRGGTYRWADVATRGRAHVDFQHESRIIRPFHLFSAGSSRRRSAAAVVYQTGEISRMKRLPVCCATLAMTLLLACGEDGSGGAPPPPEIAVYVTQGRDMEEARSMIKEAVELLLASYQENAAQEAPTSFFKQSGVDLLDGKGWDNRGAGSKVAGDERSDD